MTNEWGYERTREDDARHVLLREEGAEQGVLRTFLERLRRRGGRPRADYHSDWAARYRELDSSAHEYDEWSPVEGERPIGHLEICLQVAIEDYAAYSGRWKYDPASDEYNRKRGAQRISSAVKPLI